MDKETIDKLMKDYIEVCNKALKANEHSFPYQQLLDVSKRIIGDHEIKIAVYDDDPQASYTLHFKDSQFHIDENTPPEPKGGWHTSISYLKHVVENPNDYIKNPAKLDFDWLKSRMGL